MATERLIVAITGASGPVYGVRLLEALRSHTDFEVHLILSTGAAPTIDFELGRSCESVAELAHVVHDENNLAASIASGSFITRGMIVAPCSAKTLSGIATSFNDNLIVRAADVCLKERRPLVLVVRETPLHIGHLRLMQQVTEAGAVVLPPVPGFYAKPKTIEELVDHSVMRALDQVGVHLHLVPRWQGEI
jgi:4-hydroxy-3-polyprenylbenzoate decarboxylase